jgi:hypothetical protein
MVVPVARVVLSRLWLAALPAGLALTVLACSGADAGEPTGTAGAGGSSAGQTTTVPTAGTSSGGTATNPGGAGTSTNPAGGTFANMAGSSAGGAPSGGSATGGSATGGSATGGSGNDNGMDTMPARALMVNSAAAANKSITFTAKQADPMAGSSTPDTNAGSQEHGQVDTKRPKVQGKLVLTLGGIGTCCGQGGIGGFAVGLGFHEMGIAMLTTNEALPNKYKDALKANPMDPEANRQMGDGRMEAFDGKDRVDWLNITPHDSLATRTAMALKYMQTQDPGGDWAYFLNADDTVRWSDVYLVGYSYGSQTLAVVAKYVRIGRGIATSGPVDEGFPNATWIKATSATPLDRMYGLFGSTNLDTKVQTSQAAGWLGQPVTVNTGAALADLMMGHLFILQGQGHSEFCAGDGGGWKALCQYSFGVMQ